MTVHTGARFGLSYGFQAGDSGWGASFNLQASLLEAMLALVLQSDTLLVPPSAPAEDDAYFVPTGASGAWVGHAGQIAAYQGGDWNFYPIPTYMRARILDRNGFFFYNGASWVSEVTPGGEVTSVAGRGGVVTLSVGDVAGAAPLSSPSFTGNPSAPNQPALSRNSYIANTKYVDDAFTAATAGGKVTTVAGRAGAVTLTHNDITDWAASLSGYVLGSSLGSAAVMPASAFKAAGAAETWATLPSEAQSIPLPIVIPGKPGVSQVMNIVIPMAITIAANFALTVAYQGTQATANMDFTVNKISGGTVTALGTITLGTASKTAITRPTVALTNFAAGDVLQVVAPAAQDATGADIGITIMGSKV